MNDNFQIVLENISILKTIEKRIGNLKKSGTNYQACCPFHNEKSPSFFVSVAKNRYKCFGCGETGDAINFVAKFDNISNYDAMLRLAEENNITIKKNNMNDIYENVYTDLKVASIFFTNNLLNNLSVKKYIYQRGVISIELLKTFEIGYAPANYTIPNASPDALKKGGMYTVNDNWLFRERIMFPIYNNNYKIVGFTARDFSNNYKSPKYINTPETPLYNKRKILFGLKQAVSHIKRTNIVIITEGPFDVINLHAVGYKNVVATCGTSLTIDHANMLKRLCDQVIMLMDGDNAGKKATIRAFDKLLLAGFKKIVVIDLPKDKDAADLKEQITNYEEMSAVEFMFNYVDNDDEEEKIRLILDIISQCPLPIRRDILIKELSNISGINQYTLLDELKYILKQKNI